MKSKNSRREFVKSTSLGLAGLAGCLSLSAIAASKLQAQRPNIVVIFVDDMGYGDLGVYGHPTIRTPNLDRIAAQGQKWTNFYAAAPVCTPSRAALLTGRLPVRNGMTSDIRRVFHPDSLGGIPASEITLAQALKTQNYTTACIGKWHLGHLPEFLPTSKGFDYFYGIPYSADEDETRKLGKLDYKFAKQEDFNVPLMRNTEIIERPVDQTTLTRRYTHEAGEFIRQNRNGPFFLYLAFNFPHVPLFVAKDIAGQSQRGLYGDVVEEIDDNVGKVLKTLEDEGVASNTLVIFTSDNGPWLTFETHGGSAGLLRGGKGQTFEGGVREPAIFYWPGIIEPAVVSGLGSTMDIFTTVSRLVGAKLPKDRIMDGVDLSQTLLKQKPSPRKTLIYYRGTKVYAIRMGAYKAHFYTQEARRVSPLTKQNPPLLYNLDHDPGELYNLAKQHPGIIAQMLAYLEKHKAELVKGEDQLAPHSDSARTIPRPY